MAKVSKYCEKAQRKSPTNDLFRLEWNNVASRNANAIRYLAFTVSKSML
jgi:hypothetical protein